VCKALSFASKLPASPKKIAQQKKKKKSEKSSSGKWEAISLNVKSSPNEKQNQYNYI
jgi:hypothetical protein